MSGSRHALIVATDTYQDGDLERLLSPGEDAVALAEVLGDPEVGGFGVEVVRNEPAHVVSRRVEDFFADRNRNDSLLLHFSCHGLKNASGELFFAAADTLPRRLSSTAVSADFVRRCMAEGRARNAVLLLDCCYGGAFTEGMGPRAAGDVNVFDSFSGEGFGSGRGWAVITASNAMEYAFEGTELTADRQVRPSVFTSALAAGLASGEADLDADGRVSINELYDYVYDQVRQENPHQTPSRSIHLQGDVYLAHSRRRRTDAEGLPEELRLAVASPDMFSRRGSVSELRRRLQSSDRETAESACQALHGLIRNDIRSIADEASRALDEVAVRPSPELLDFGQIGQYSPEPHRRIQLLGPLLARECVPHSGKDRIHVTEEADALDVSVDTTRPGRLEGTITLEGRAGDSVVPVRAEVVPVSSSAPVSGPTPAPTPRPTLAPAPVPTPVPEPRPTLARPAPPPPPRSMDTGHSPAADPLPGPLPPLRPVHAAGSGPGPAPQGPSPVRSAPGVPPPSPAGHRFASFGERLAARAIDYVLVFFFALAAVFTMVVVWAAFSAADSSGQTLGDIVLWLFFLGWGVLLFLYDWLFLRYGGATLGKMFLGLRAVHTRNGGPLSHGQAAGRAALFGLPQTIPLLGNLVVFFESLTAQADPRKQALHDRSAGTVVVQRRR